VTFGKTKPIFLNSSNGLNLSHRTSRPSPFETDSGELAVAAPRRYRNRKHLRYVAQQACLVCGRKPSDPTTWASPSLAHSAARSAMSSRSRSVAGITGRCIARATSAAGGGRLASTRSKLPAGSGRRRTEWDRGDLGEKYHLGRKALPRPPIQGARTSAPLRPRKRNPAYRIFPDKRTRSGWRRGIDNDGGET
jgi:hypothetical protein